MHHALISHPSNDLEVYGIYVRNETQRKDLKNQNKDNLKIFDTYEEVLSDGQVNIVVIVTATPTHFDLAFNALSAKKNVVVGMYLFFIC